MAGREEGQDLVEFALVIPVVLLFLLVVLEFGFAFGAYVNVMYAARDGSRAGAVYLYQPGCPSGGDDGEASNDMNRASGNSACGAANYADNIRATVARTMGVWPGFDATAHVVVTYTESGGHFPNRNGDTVNVQVAHPYRFLSPLFNSTTITMTGQATAVIEPSG